MRFLRVSTVISSLFLVFLFHVEAQGIISESNGRKDVNKVPTVAVIFGILCIMLSLTFLLFMCGKLCQSASSDLNGGNLHRFLDRVSQGDDASRFSGLNMSVIEALPFFKFSSLKGLKDNLECAVCLSKFEETNVLRLLPKCRHAFHVDCIDEWLQSHSSCPLCRRKVEAKDLSFSMNSNSFRFLVNPSKSGRKDDVEFTVQRDGGDSHHSSRFSVGTSLRKITEDGNDDCSAIHDDNQQFLQKFKNRWSDLNSSDLVVLNSVMLNAISSERFLDFDSDNEGLITGDKRLKKDLDIRNSDDSKINPFVRSSISFLGSSSDLDSYRKLNDSSMRPTASNQRSISEIVGLSRFADSNKINKNNESTNQNFEEDHVRRQWFSIAKQTINKFSLRRPELESPKRVSNV